MRLNLVTHINGYKKIVTHIKNYSRQQCDLKEKNF